MKRKKQWKIWGGSDMREIHYILIKMPSGINEARIFRYSGQETNNNRLKEIIREKEKISDKDQIHIYHER